MFVRWLVHRFGTLPTSNICLMYSHAYVVPKGLTFISLICVSSWHIPNICPKSFDQHIVYNVDYALVKTLVDSTYHTLCHIHILCWRSGIRYDLDPWLATVPPTPSPSEGPLRCISGVRHGGHAVHRSLTWRSIRTS